MKPLKYIIVGTGGWGGHWCQRVLPRLAELGKAVPAAAVDMNPEALKNATDWLKLPADKCYTDIDAAFDDNPADFAIVVVPPAAHEGAVDAALAHDMDVLTEKPIADTMEASCRIYKKIKAAGKKSAVTMSHRCDQDKVSLERAVKSGEFGQLNYVVCRFTHNCREFGSWGEFRHRMPDPLLVEGTVHHFDVFRAVSGANAKTVYAETWNPEWGDYQGDSTGLITMAMENGVHCMYEGAKANASTMNGWGNEYFRAECRDGSLELSERKLRVLRGPAWDKPSAQNLPLVEQAVWQNAWIAEQYCDWLNGGPAPATEMDDNIQCAALLFAAVESAHTGKVVDVQAFLRRHLEVTGK
jgi:predicted dehydrogenase